ncbi:MAG: hypothetical protein QME96_16250, partial [Myxococcota bacterium]|nr:hypothetical protein [Myxococcota bacterium]
MRISREERPELLRALRFDAGQADHADESFVRRGFLPIAEHLRALEPEVVLVVGDRGAGKTMLVRVAGDEGLRHAALGSAPSVRMPGGRIEWLRGWPLQRRGPDARGWRAFAEDHRGDRSAMEAIWAACLLRSVREHLKEGEAASLRAVLDVPGADVSACHEAFAAAGARPLVVLDSLDARLEAADRWLFVAYDELDTVVTSGVDALRAVLGGLVGFWVQHSRRWSRLRAKLFLRT